MTSLAGGKPVHYLADEDNDWNPSLEDIASKVAVAALKFADLSNARTTSYVFDLDRFTSFEGKTGPYLLYQAVRIKSLLRKAEDQDAAPSAIMIPRSTITARMPHKSARYWYFGGMAKKVKISEITNTLSIDSAFSMKNPV